MSCNQTKKATGDDQAVDQEKGKKRIGEVSVAFLAK